MSIAAGRGGTYVQLGSGGYGPNYFAAQPPLYQGEFQQPWQSQSEFAPQPYEFSETPPFDPSQWQQAPVQPPYSYSGPPQFDPSLQSPDGSIPSFPSQFAGPSQYDPSQQYPDGSPLPPQDGSDYQQYDDPNQFKS